MNFENKLRELADRATPEWETGVEFGTESTCGEDVVYETWHARGPIHRNPIMDDGSTACAGLEHGDNALADDRFIAFNDPETANLVADVIAAARYFWKVPLNYTESRRLEQALLAIDSHHAKREGK
jgi:hypothetical protein